MELRDWIRKRDFADCGGTAVEGGVRESSGGTANAFHGARMACHRNCVVAEGDPLSTLSNGAAMVHDGQFTSGGCRLVSSLKGGDGVAEGQ